MVGDILNIPIKGSVRLLTREDREAGLFARSLDQTPPGQQYQI